MKITIKNIQAILFCNLLIFGFTACSSEPAPWTRPDETAWSDNQDSADSRVEEPVVVEEPVAEIEPEPEPYMEPAIIEEPVPVVAEVAVAEPVELSAEQQIMAMDTGYAVQVYASSTMSRMEQYQADNELDGMLAVGTDRDGSIIYVLVSPHSDRASANVAAVELEQKTGAKPWVRSIEGLQKVVAQ